MESSASQFVGSIPEHYERGLVPVIFDPFAADLAARLSAFQASDVLEVACGTGVLTRRLGVALGARARLTATDLNPDMLERARRAVPPDHEVIWRVADGTSLDFEPGAFDAVVCQFGLMFFPDKAAGMREARRVLRPGGRYFFNVWDGFTHNPFGRIAHETIGSFFPDDPPAFYLTPFGFADESVIRSLLASAGFRGIEVERLRKDAASPTARAFADGLVRGNPVLLMIAERGIADPDQVVAALEQALVKEGGDRPFRSTMQALVVTATA
jgi:SAM-dependent methyltransferase